MMISTRGRYALRVLVALAENDNGEYIPLKDIAISQGISQKYIESIMTMLSKNNLVEGIHGKGGGYRINRKPEDYLIGDILRVTESSLAPVACLDSDASPCERASTCRTLPMWGKLNNLINNFFDSITIHDLMEPNDQPDC